MKHFFMAILFSVLTLTGPAHSQAVDDASRTYADQFAKESVIVHALLIDGEPAQQEAIQTVLANPERFTPMVLYPFSRALFVSGRKDEAAVWFYSAQVRARFDARRTTDSSARQLVLILSDHFGRPINIHATQSPSKLRGLVAQALAWDRAAPHDYDYRWIYPHGLGILDESTPGPSEWVALAETNRVEYKNSMEEALGEVNWSDRKSLIGTAAASFEKLTEEKTVAQESEDADAGDNNSVYVKID